MKRATGDKGAADRLASLIVRSRGACQYPDCGVRMDLQCCHIVGRTYNRTRTRLDNLLCLCATHHRLIDTWPDEKLKVTQHVYGEGHYLALKIDAESTVGQRFDWTAERRRLEELWKQVAA
jgi:hypothetical protein